MAPSRQLRLGAFMRPATIHTGAWRYPGAFPDANFNFAHIKRFAQTLEKVTVGTVESGFMTKDLALLVGADQKWLSTTGFLDKVDENLKAAMA